MATEEFTGEKWRAIYGWPYEVSDMGRVRRSVAATGTRVGRLLRQRVVRRYLSVLLCERGRRKGVHVHRLVALAFCGACPPGHQVNHRDGDRLNNTATNLEWLTPRENTLHAHKTGLAYALKGEAHPNATLTNGDIHTIRVLRAGGMSQAQIGAHVGCSQTTVGRILRAESWAHV